MKIFKDTDVNKILLLAVLALFITILLGGCAANQECKPEIQVVYKTIEVYKEVPCNVPEVKCDFNGAGYEPTKKMLECIVEQKKAMGVCRPK